MQSFISVFSFVAQAEEAAMAKLVQERLEADQRPERLKEKQRKLRSEGSMKKQDYFL